MKQSPTPTDEVLMNIIKNVKMKKRVVTKAQVVEAWTFLSLEKDADVSILRNAGRISPCCFSESDEEDLASSVDALRTIQMPPSRVANSESSSSTSTFSPNRSTFIKRLLFELGVVATVRSSTSTDLMIRPEKNKAVPVTDATALPVSETNTAVSAVGTMPPLLEASVPLLENIEEHGAREKVIENASEDETPEALAVVADNTPTETRLFAGTFFDFDEADTIVEFEKGTPLYVLFDQQERARIGFVLAHSRSKTVSTFVNLHALFLF